MIRRVANCCLGEVNFTEGSGCFMDGCQTNITEVLVKETEDEKRIIKSRVVQHCLR